MVPVAATAKVAVAFGTTVWLRGLSVIKGALGVTLNVASLLTTSAPVLSVTTAEYAVELSYL
jgi:hypothetical protein